MGSSAAFGNLRKECICFTKIFGLINLSMDSYTISPSDQEEWHLKNDSIDQKSAISQVDLNFLQQLPLEL